MPIKSIVDIEVDDSQFKDFLANFGKYQTELEKLPGVWSLTNDAIGGAKTAIETMTAAVLEQTALLKKQESGQEKVRSEVLRTDRAMVSLGRSSKVVFGYIRDTTSFLLKWGSLIGGLGGILAGAGGFFGFEALARSASSARTGALGLGVAPNELQAANIAYARIPGAGDILGRIADTQGDVTKNYLLSSRLGISQQDINGKNPAELLPEVLTKLREKWLALPPNLRNTLAPSLGLTEFASIGQLRTLGNLDPGELADLAKQYKGSASQVGGTSETDRRYQDFLTRLDTAGQKLQNTFIDGLVKLSGPIGDVVSAFTDLVKSGMNSPEFKAGIESFASWIENFGKELDSPEFKRGMSDFITDLGIVVDRLQKFGKWVDEWLQDKPQDPKTAPQPSLNGVPIPFTPGAKGAAYLQDRTDTGFRIMPASYRTNTSGAGQFGALEQQYGLPAGLLSTVRRVESGGDDLAISGAGAMGPFQFMPGTAKEYGINPFDLGQSSNAAARYLQKLMGMFGGDIEKAAAGYNWGEGNVQRDIREHGDYWKQFLPKETADYIEKIKGGLSQTALTAQPGQGVNIRVFNQTGGNVVGISTQLAV